MSDTISMDIGKLGFGLMRLPKRLTNMVKNHFCGKFIRYGVCSVSVC